MYAPLSDPIPSNVIVWTCTWIVVREKSIKMSPVRTRVNEINCISFRSIWLADRPKWPLIATNQCYNGECTPLGARQNLTEPTKALHIHPRGRSSPGGTNHMRRFQILGEWEESFWDFFKNFLVRFWASYCGKHMKLQCMALPRVWQWDGLMAGLCEREVCCCHKYYNIIR